MARTLDVGVNIFSAQFESVSVACMLVVGVNIFGAQFESISAESSRTPYCGSVWTLSVFSKSHLVWLE